MNATAKSSQNYTEDMITRMSVAYDSNPTRATVDALAEEFDKTPRSIIAKLSALGLYIKPERVTKRGEPVILKEELVTQIQNAVGRELPSLAKMTKPDLSQLVEALVG